MDVDKKSRLLSVCFRSIFALPLLDALEKHSCLFLEPPNIQVQPAQPRAGREAQGTLRQDVRLSLLCVAGWGTWSGHSTSMAEALHSCLKTLGPHLPTWGMAHYHHLVRAKVGGLPGVCLFSSSVHNGICMFSLLT